MKLFFDTETTGKADFRAGFQSPSQPRIVQMASMLTDDKGEELSMFSLIIQPDGWTIPEEAAAIHGISTELATQCGVPIVYALATFAAMAKQADTIVAHNIDFDWLVTLSEFHRAKREPKWQGCQRFCTMKASTALCKLPGQYGDFKWPKLTEALQILLNKDLQDAHDAFADMRGCKELYFHLTAK